MALLRTVQVDRVFRAGPAPQPPALTVDPGLGGSSTTKLRTKMASTRLLRCPSLRRLFAPQIEAYANVLRNLHGADAKICGALYYPRSPDYPAVAFDWWRL